MARPREFDLDDAIERATEVFWAHGYEGASLPVLLDGMGLTRGSLYKAFKDKRSLFLKVLKHYENRNVQAGYDILTDKNTDDGRKRIQTMFANIHRIVASGDHRGCLLCSAAAGPSAYDPDIAKQVAEGLSILRNGMDEALKDSPKHSAWLDDKRSRLADHLLTQYVGLRIMARSRASLGVLEHAADGVADLLD